MAGHESLLVINCLSHLNLNILSVSNWELVTSHSLKTIQLAQKHPEGEEDGTEVKR